MAVSCYPVGCSDLNHTLILTGFFCSYCDSHFPFKSKYMRHMKSEGHRFAVNLASTMQDEEELLDEVCLLCRSSKKK